MCIVPVSQWRVRKPTKNIVSSPQKYFQANRKVFFQCFQKALEQHWDIFWAQFCKRGTWFCTLSYLSFICSSWLEAQHFFSSTLFVIPCLVFFLIRRQSSEGVLCFTKLATMLKMCCVTDFFLGTWSKFMQSKTKPSAHPVMFFNPLMLVVKRAYIL